MGKNIKKKRKDILFYPIKEYSFLKYDTAEMAEHEMKKTEEFLKFGYVKIEKSFIVVRK